MRDELRREIEQLLQRGQKIEAIKRHRQETGSGLAEAKAAVESVAQGDPVSGDDQAIDSDMIDEVVSLLGRGDRIEAVRRYRDQTGTSLKEATAAVESIAEKNGMPLPSGGGCLGIILVAVAVTSAFITCAQ